jgi:hypothetical protein
VGELVLRILGVVFVILLMFLLLPLLGAGIYSAYKIWVDFLTGRWRD